jgi:hypothetical protein
MRKFPTRILKLSFENDILPAEQKLINQYGFLKEEINFIMKYKPSFILFEIEGDRTNMNGVYKYFVEKRGFELDAIRTLVVKYPFILSKTTEEFEEFFNLMQSKGVSEEETMRVLLDCPKLISKDLEKQMKEIFFIFHLYHQINEQEVLEIFRNFPYLFCCELNKI